ncbi:uncharacterized protein LOC106636185 [Copidosoma floridanum]|uniref:uncharacterized protein LOC106636185 n=1 Tax=Copidosoma floridanum TaxID=29053 RepID=UPI0006C95E14|nr:uncharacterized protein LOC106636185 [Copidosoma floridanum]
MSQRRITRSRRSSNISGILNDNTDILENADPLWANRTVVRPSTSLNLTTRASSVLNSNSTVKSSRWTEGWYTNLSESSTSRVFEREAKKMAFDEEDTNVTKDPQVENESSDEPERKVLKFKALKKAKKPSEENNVFMEVLHKTDSISKNLNDVEGSEGNLSESTNDDSKMRKKLRPRLFKSSKNAAKDFKNKFDQVFGSESLTEKIHDSSKSPRSLKNLSVHTPSTSKTERQLKYSAKFFSKNKITDKHQLSSDVVQKFSKALEENNSSDDVSQGKKIEASVEVSPNKTNEGNASDSSLRSENTPNAASTATSRSRSLQKKTEENFMNNVENKENSTSNRRSNIEKSWFEASFGTEKSEAENDFINESQKMDEKRKSIAISTLRDVQNAIPNIGLKKPRIILENIMVPGSENYVPVDQIVSNTKIIPSTDKIDKSNIKLKISEMPKNLQLSHTYDSESTENQDDSLRPLAPAQSTLTFHGKPIAAFRMSAIPETPKRTKESELQVDEENVDVDDFVDVEVYNSNEEGPLPSRPHSSASHPLSNKNRTITTDDERVRAFLTEKPMISRREKALQESTSNIDPSVWATIKKKTEALKVKIEASNQHTYEEQRKQEKKKAIINEKLRRVKVAQEARKKEKLKKPINKAFYVSGKPYKQPKLPKPKSWVTPRLYKYLWKAMEPKFGLKTRVKSEKFVLKLSSIYTVIIRRNKYENYVADLDNLLVEMAKLGIIKTRYDFYRFCSDFMPPDFNKKVVPMMLPGNKRNIPYDKKLVNKPIIDDDSSVDGASEERLEHRSEISSGSKSE